jgi:sterol desaturase/sphingolipid hydroxylase (fatty acid hydroxylase superfamily)
MQALLWLARDTASRIVDLFNPGSAYGAPSLVGALLFIVGWFVWRRHARGRKVEFKTFLRAVFPKSIWLHPSSLIDMKLWALNAFVLASGYGLLAFSSLWVRDATVAGLQHAFGVHAPLPAPVGLVLLAATLLELLAYEFAYFIGHFAFHRVPWLWQFHKVHHAAETMTTFTEMRQHPVEILAFVNLIALATGFVFGAMTYLFGPGTGHLTLFNSNIVLMIFLITWGHLRHSHIWIPFRGLAGKLFQSPAHHQVHHSVDPAHYDKNLGFALAVWDWAFGTLHIPSVEREVKVFGVGAAEQPAFDSVMKNLALPFVRAGEDLAGRTPAPLAGERSR